MARTEPLETLTSNPKEFIQRMKDSGERFILTVDGKAELVVQSADVDSNINDKYDHVVDEETEAILIERSKQAEAGLGRPAKEVLEEFRARQNARL